MFVMLLLAGSVLAQGIPTKKGKEVVLYLDDMLTFGSERGDILRMTLNDESINAASKLMKKCHESSRKKKRNGKGKRRHVISDILLL